MPNYLLEYSPEAKKGIDHLPAENLKLIAKQQFEELSHNPFKGKKLVGKLAGLYSLRITRRYRAIYQINQTHHTIYILNVLHRKDVYR